MLNTLNYLAEVVHRTESESAALFRLRRNACWEFVESCHVNTAGEASKSRKPDTVEYLEHIDRIISSTGSNIVFENGEKGEYFHNSAMIIVRLNRQPIACISVRGLTRRDNLKNVINWARNRYIKALENYNRDRFLKRTTNFSTATLEKSRVSQILEQFTEDLSASSVILVPENMDLNRENIYLNGNWERSRSRKFLKNKRALRRAIAGTASSEIKLVDGQSNIYSIQSFTSVNKPLFYNTGSVYCYRTINSPGNNFILLICWHDGCVLFPGEFETLMSMADKISIAVTYHFDHARQLEINSNRVARNLTFRSDKIYQFTRHEIKNLASTSSATLEALRDDLSHFANKHESPLPKNAKMRIRTLFDKFSRINRALSSLGTVNENELSWQRDVFEVRDKIQTVANSFSDQFGRNDINFDLAGDRKRIDGYPHIFEQIFVNLFENSLKAFDRNVNSGAKWIILDVEDDGEIVEIVYKDSAGGIRLLIEPEAKETKLATAQESERVFEIGFSTDSGTGFGMAIARSCIQVHHGDIRVVNNTETGVEIRLNVRQSALATSDALLVLRTVGR